MKAADSLDWSPVAVEHYIVGSDRIPFPIGPDQKEVPEDEIGVGDMDVRTLADRSSRRFVRLRTAPVIPLHETASTGPMPP